MQQRKVNFIDKCTVHRKIHLRQQQQQYQRPKAQMVRYSFSLNRHFGIFILSLSFLSFLYIFFFYAEANLFAVIILLECTVQKKRHLSNEMLMNRNVIRFKNTYTNKIHDLLISMKLNFAQQQ